MIITTQEEVSQWEAVHTNTIIGWRSEWDIYPDIKVLSFDYKNSENKKETKIFNISIIKLK